MGFTKTFKEEIEYDDNNKTTVRLCESKTNQFNFLFSVIKTLFPSYIHTTIGRITSTMTMSMTTKT